MACLPWFLPVAPITCFFFILLLHANRHVIDLSVFSSHCCSLNTVICKGPFLNSKLISLHIFSTRTLRHVITILMAFQKISLILDCFRTLVLYFQPLVLSTCPYIISILSTKLSRQRKPVFLSSFLTSLNWPPVSKSTLAPYSFPYI